jgi:hypothetical protein
MKTEKQPTATISLPSVDLDALREVSGGRYGVNRPRSPGNRPNRKR